jgi:hypothetical protein
MDANPFQFGVPVTGPYFTGRAEEVARIRRGLLGAGRVLVHGPRRMGKSSAIAVAAKAVAREGGVVVRADLSTATTYLDIPSRLLRSLYQETRPFRLRPEEVVAGVTPRVRLKPDPAGGPPSVSFGVQRRTSDESDWRRSLETVLERLAWLAEWRSVPVAVVLEGFEVVGGLGGASAEWHLRALMDRHGGLGFVFAGSRESQIQDVIGPEGAFNGVFELVPIEPLAPWHLAGWIEERLVSAGAVEAGMGAAILSRAGDRTQDAVQIARQLWYRARGLGRLVKARDVEAAFDDVVRNESAIIQMLWHELPPHQQDLLRVVALGARQLYSMATRDRYGLPAASSVQRAVDGLTARGLLVAASDELMFDSPFIGEWVRREVAPDLG